MKLFAVLCVFLSVSASASAQDSHFLRYAKDEAKPLSAFEPARPYYIVRFTDHLFPAAGIVRQLDDHTAIVRFESDAAIAEIKNTARISRANDDWKYSPSAEKNIPDKVTADFNVTTTDTHVFLESLRNIKEVMILYTDEPSNSAVIRTTGLFLRQNILSMKEVIFVDTRVEPHTEIAVIGYKRDFHGINAVDYDIPGANGKDIVVGVKEQMMEEQDLDVYKRVIYSSLAPGTVSNHATVIASIIGGAGNSFYDGRGIANGCHFFPTSFTNIFPDDADILNTNHVTIQNHSYGTVIQQFYGAEAVSYDQQTWQNPHLLHVFSAGNQGTATPGSGPYANIPGAANITGNFKMAKNILTVGAIDNKGNIPAESSAGPVYDGRIAPQLVALGPNGTSDAAAVVSGTIAVLQQVYADSNSMAPAPASLIKALLYNNADDIFRSHIDYKTGYGLLNSLASIKALQQKHFDGGTVNQSQQWARTISIPPGCAQIKLTLAWTDTPALPNNNKALDNDLDIELVNTGTGTIYKPWVLSPVAHPDSLSKLPVRKRDSLNTAEQVSIQLPPAGIYEMRVSGTRVTGPAIAFHIAYKLDTLNTFHFTSPQHASDINREEDPFLNIRWRTFVADTNQTGELYISYDVGASWQLIRSGHKIYTNHYAWPIKDTNSRALLKMETSFGSFISKQFVISKVTKLNVDFVCTDSLKLSWNKHIYAGSYNLFTLVDSPYLKQLLNVADTFVVLDRNLYPALVYAVQPVLTNGIPAARSVAQDISLQGVYCFYRTFYYTLFDQNSLELVLELSAPDYVDSLFFEQVSSTGQLINTVGSIRTNQTSFLYDQLVNNVPPGTSYWRVRIRLKSGATVYTHIINVLTSGNRFIIFYPNPSRRADQLLYVLKQGVPPDSRLQFFDMTGRMVKDHTELSGTLNAMDLPAGMLIYKLMTRDGQVLETGKLLVMQ